MNNRDQCKVEFKTENTYRRERCVYYRIVPSELPLLQRLFCNPWTTLYHANSRYSTSVSESYTSREYVQEVLQLKTYGDVRRYLENADKIVRKAKVEQLEKGEIWPDEL